MVKPPMRNLETMQGWPESASWMAACTVTWIISWNFWNLSGRNIGENKGVKVKDVINHVFSRQCTR